MPPAPPRTNQQFHGLKNVGDVQSLIETAVRITLGLSDGIGKARTLAYLAQTALKALEAGELEERIEALERAAKYKGEF